MVIAFVARPKSEALEKALGRLHSNAVPKAGSIPYTKPSQLLYIFD